MQAFNVITAKLFTVTEINFGRKLHELAGEIIARTINDRFQGLPPRIDVAPLDRGRQPKDLPVGDVYEPNHVIIYNYENVSVRFSNFFWQY